MPDKGKLATLDELVDKAFRNWEVVSELLAQGVTAYYEDKQGRWVKHHPDGTIEVIEEREQ